MTDHMKFDDAAYLARRARNEARLAGAGVSKAKGMDLVVVGEEAHFVSSSCVKL